MGFFSDLEEIEVPSKKKGFFVDLQEESPKEVSRTRSLLSAFPKGVIRGGKQLSQLQDPISSAISSFAQNKPDLEEELSQRFLPTQKGQFAEEVLETAGELTPSFAMGPGGFGAKAAQVAGGSLSKNVLKQMGAPELVQDIGAGVGSVIPGGIKAALSKKINPSAAQKDIYDLLKKEGMTDKQITPFLQSPKKVKFLAKWGKPFLDRDDLKQNLRTVKEVAYDAIEDRASKLPPLSGLRKTAFLQQLGQKFNDLDYDLQKLIEKDVRRLASSDISFSNLSEMGRVLNRKVGKLEGGKAALGILKEPIQKAQSWISPELYKEKSVLDKGYGNVKNLLSKLPKDAQSKFLDKSGGLGGIGGLAAAIVSGSPIATTVGKAYLATKGSQYLAAKFLTSPRFQGMQRKLLKAVLEGSTGSVINLTEKIQEDLEKIGNKSKD
jgi:hypothetical protein